MRRMIPQKMIDKIVARLEREEQTKEMLENITVQTAGVDIESYSINLSSDGETYLTISGQAEIKTADECDIVLANIPSEFLSKLESSGLYPGTNSLGGGDSVYVHTNNTLGHINLTFSEGEPRDVFSTITLSSVVKDS